MSTVVHPAPPASIPCDEHVLPLIARRPVAWYALAWLPLLLLVPIVGTIQDGHLGQLLALLLLAAAHLVTTLMRDRLGPGRRTEVLVAASTVMVAGYQVLWSEHQVFLYPLLALGMAVGIRRRTAMGFVGGLAVSGAIAAGFTTGSLADALVFAVVTYMAGISAHLIDVLAETAAALRATQRRLARTAVLEERERFSRDLHDLLGHTLSLIVVKAEAVRRFVPVDPAAAAEHAHGIEDIGRTALGEVRQAVAGYRETTLEDELEAADAALTDAGVQVEVTADAPTLPPAVDRLFAWVVREGTTNILRHARARTVTVLVESDGGEATVEITDDGSAHGRADPGRQQERGPARPGSGLSGLRERAELLDGVLAADRTENGFRLGVSVPTGEGTTP
ncbi:MAG: histidine kinase [Brachybacterium sp.]|uniref:sensor histidine kinase n=1 Tax=Brachybacterium sp. TaxID=1891286 RepID=UPI0026499D8E|nr:histidine kinase [Brachybacterium sp.]MDN5685667.1 histidine kinase [Brachybacterium sp.]